MNQGRFILILVSAAMLAACGKFQPSKVQFKDQLRESGFVEKDLVYCEGPNVRRFQQTLYPSQPNGPKFEYAYELIPAKTNPAAALTIVLVPGGPGQGFIGLANQINLPSQYNWLLIDPRGVQCNGLSVVRASPQPGYPQDFFTTQQHVEDLTRVLAHAGLTDDNYIIHGISYGSVVATRLANRVEQIRAQQATYPRPRAVILEGVYSQAADGTAEAARGVEYFNYLKPSFPAQVTTYLTGNNSPTIGDIKYDFSAEAFQMLYIGPYPKANPFIEWLKALASGQTGGEPDPTEPRDTCSSFDDYAKDDFPRPFVSYDEFQNYCELKLALPLIMSCRELESEPAGRFLLTGDVASTYLGTGICALAERYLDFYNQPRSNPLTMSARWDSVNFKSSYYTAYFSGFWDMATVREQGLRHFTNHNQANRIRLLFPEYSHTPLFTQARAFGCYPSLVNAVASRTNANVTEAARSCFDDFLYDGVSVSAQKPTITTLNAGQ